MSDPTRDLKLLVELASDALLEQKLVPLRLPPKWERPTNFPLPNTKLAVENDDGSVTREYRAMALLEYVNYVLEGHVKGEAISKRLAEKRAAGDDDEL